MASRLQSEKSVILCAAQRKRGLIRLVGFALLVLSSWNASGADVWTSDVPVGEGPNCVLCTALQAHLNAEGTKCSEVAILTFPQFARPPWEALDTSQHIDLIARLMSYASVGESHFEEPIHLDSYYERAKEFVRSGGRLLIWHGHFLSNLGDNLEVPTPVGDQNLVQLVYNPGIGNPYATSKCKAKAAQLGLGPTFLVLPDLSRPDLRVGVGTAKVLQTHQPRIYRDQVLFVGSGVGYGPKGRLLSAQADVFKNYERAGLKGGVCIFKYFAKRGNKEQ